jgi:MFS transporter, FLVCR family, disrupted in renal carcinoma protein 2
MAILGKWWVVAVYSMVALYQGAIWSIPGNLQTIYMDIFNIDGNTVQLLLNYGPILYLVTALPFSWHIDRYGSRLSVFISIYLVLISSILRMFCTNSSILSIALLHISFILNAAAGPVAMGACSKISEDFFPPNERTFATAIMASANNCAGILQFFLIPVLVTSNDVFSMMKLNYFYLAASIVMVICAHIYFPSHPKLAPSNSAKFQQSKQELFTISKFLRSIWDLLRNRNYMVLLIIYSSVCGLTNVWSSFLIPVLSTINYSTNQAGWLGFASSLLGVIFAMILGRVTVHPKYQRLVMIGLLSFVTLAYLVFSFFVSGYIPLQSTGIFGFLIIGASATVATSFFNAALPLLYELSCESAYPIPQGTSLIVLTSGCNVVSGLFLAIPEDVFGITWLNWASVAVNGFAVLGVIFLYDGSIATRFNYDTETHEKLLDEESNADLVETEDEAASLIK